MSVRIETFQFCNFCESSQIGRAYLAALCLKREIKEVLILIKLI